MPRHDVNFVAFTGQSPISDGCGPHHRRWGSCHRTAPAVTLRRHFSRSTGPRLPHRVNRQVGNVDTSRGQLYTPSAIPHSFRGMETSSEAHVSAERAGPQASARVSFPHGDQERPQSPGPPPRQRAQGSVGLGDGLKRYSTVPFQKVSSCFPCRPAIDSVQQGAVAGRSPAKRCNSEWPRTPAPMVGPNGSHASSAAASFCARPGAGANGQRPGWCCRPAGDLGTPTAKRIRHRHGSGSRQAGKSAQQCSATAHADACGLRQTSFCRARHAPGPITF